MTHGYSLFQEQERNYLVSYLSLLQQKYELDGLRNRNLFLMFLETVKSRIKVLADLVFGEASSWLARAHLSPCPHMVLQSKCLCLPIIHVMKS